jgi:hypothetical protein
MMPHNSAEKLDEVPAKRGREAPAKDDLAVSEGVQSFGRNFSLPEMLDGPNKRQKKEVDADEEIHARNRLLDAQLLLDAPT